MIIELHAKTDVGRVRSGNEDNFLVLDLTSGQSWTASDEADALAAIEALGSYGAPKFPDKLSRFTLGERGAVFVVSDGMGGALAGEVASRMAVEKVRELLTEGDEDDERLSEDAPLVARLRRAADYVNYAIYRSGQENAQHSGMGATLTGAVVTRRADGSGAELGLVQVGDSRAYLIRGEQIIQATKDQSLVQQLVDAGQITQHEAETHMFRNVILQALGAQSEITPVAYRVALRRGDTLLMCSDGLSGKMSGEEMRRTVADAEGNLAQACHKLIALANERGGEDNITVVLARFDGEDLQADDQSPLAVEIIPSPDEADKRSDTLEHEAPTETP